MGFFKIIEEPGRKGEVIVKPEYVLLDPDSDLMTRGGNFYALWNGARWSIDELDVIRLIDPKISEHISKEKKSNREVVFKPSYLNNFRYRNNAAWSDFSAFVKNRPSNFVMMDQKLIFASDKPKRLDHTSKRLPYDMVSGPIDNYEELMNVLFEQEEREKLEWAVGSILSGDSRFNQKFIVLYGEAGTGKSTFLNIIEQLFPGYHVAFDAKSLGRGDSFATSSFKTAPLVAIEHDSDLSRILDNTKLNSIISHEPVYVNEKYERQYALRLNTFIFLATNKPVQITDSKSGLIRRLIDVYPSNRRINENRFYQLVEGLKDELPHIAKYCYDVYKRLGRSHYDGYKPIKMMSETDTIYNFVDDNFFEFAGSDYVTLKRAYTIYKTYIEDSGLKFILPKYKFKAELKSYFKEFHTRSKDTEGKDIYNVYVGLRRDRFESTVWQREQLLIEKTLPLKIQSSTFDGLYSEQPAQLTRPNGEPKRKWKNCDTILSEIDTSKLHYVKVPKNHIVIDFDLKGEDGSKDLSLNVEAACEWPKTYAELSRSGKGVHLHYIYDGDPKELRRIYSENIEVKVFTGDASLRRQLTKCTADNISMLPREYLPRGVKKVIDKFSVSNEKTLRKMVEKNLRKEYHASTKPSIDFINKLLNDAYDSGMAYDLRDMRKSVLIFAMNSTNQSQICVRIVGDMRFASKSLDVKPPKQSIVEYKDLVFFDVEVFRNLFIVVYKKAGKDNPCVRLVNPTAEMIGPILEFNLVGFNNKKYDNHILYASYIGYTNYELFQLSKNLISNKRVPGEIPGFAPAYHISYTDIYDYTTKRQSLKKFEIDLGIFHREFDMPWDSPIDENLWDDVGEYCENDVIATEQVFLDRILDYNARLMLSQLSGLTPNHSTTQHTAKIIFDGNKSPQNSFEYVDLSTIFPGYTFDATRKPKSLYKDENPSEGGYVYAEPGMYENVAVLDVASMHPTSIIAMNMFGPYTSRYKDLLMARIAIKHGDLDGAKKMLGGALAPYLTTKESAKELAYSVKIALNRVYGLTKAHFKNEFVDPRNVDNIVAKRGALFMIDLKLAVQAKGYKVVHIKTDSIKIVNPDDNIITFVKEYGEKYGYTFEHECIYEKFCLVNDAVYIAKVGWSENASEVGEWSATGAQFAHPYIFKTLFSKHRFSIDELTETKQVKAGRMYLDFNEALKEGEHNYIHIGKVGAFVPVIDGAGGGILYSQNDKTKKFGAVTGTKGYRWKETEVVKNLGIDAQINMGYFRELSSKAIETIEQFGDFKKFVN